MCKGPCRVRRLNCTRARPVCLHSPAACTVIDLDLDGDSSPKQSGTLLQSHFPEAMLMVVVMKPVFGSKAYSQQDR